jgi:hypothetical protein
MLQRAPLASLTAVLIVACGGSNAASVDASTADGGDSANQVHGTVNGHALVARDALWNTFAHTNGFSFHGAAAFVEIADFAGACALTAQMHAPAGSLILDLGFAIDDATGKATVPTGPGTFAVYSSASSLPASANVAQAYFGSGCSKDIAYEGVSGTIAITAVHADGSFAGSFDLVLSCASFSSCAGPDAHVTGVFSSSACTTLDVNTIPTCS